MVVPWLRQHGTIFYITIIKIGGYCCQTSVKYSHLILWFIKESMAEMEIDPRTMGQYIRTGMTNSMDLQGASVGAVTGDSGDSLFDILLQELLNAEGKQAVASSTTASQSGSSLPGSVMSDMLREEMILALSSIEESMQNLNIDFSSIESNHINSSSNINNQSRTSRPTVAGHEIDKLISAASQLYGVPEDLIKAVIETESSFNSSTVSSAGAKGLMQLMDGTARGLGVTDSFDPAQNIDGGTRYLSNQLRRFDGNEKTALAAYNAGPGRIQRLNITNDQQLMDKLHLLPLETQNYIRKIEQARSKY
jgi:soluble lytic murein transglycosylase-like protein